MHSDSVSDAYLFRILFHLTFSQQDFSLPLIWHHLIILFLVIIYICSLGFLSLAAFLFLWQVLGWKLGIK
jgi:hypothetical protein